MICKPEDKWCSEESVSELRMNFKKHHVKLPNEGEPDVLLKCAEVSGIKQRSDYCNFER